MNRKWFTRSLFLGLLGLLPFLPARAQAPDGADILSLRECIQFGVSNNPNIRKAALDIERNGYRVREGIAVYLPQVRGSANVNDNLKLQTSILPGEIFGMPGQNIAVQFGTQYNITAAVDASQIIYDRSLLVGIEAAKESQNLMRMNATKTEEQLIYDIAAAYYSAQITAIQSGIIESNLIKISRLVEIVKVQYNNGFAKKTDLDRLVVTQTNLSTEADNLQLGYAQQLILLKYHMGMPLDSAIAVPDTIAESELLANLPSEVSAEDITDLKILKMQRKLLDLSMRQVQAGYLPSLSMNFRYAYQLQQNDLRIFSEDAQWFPMSYLTLSLNVPIFDGFNKYAKSSQLRLQLMQVDQDERNLRSALEMQQEIAARKMEINDAAVEIQRANMRLADEVYQTTQVQYQGGIVPVSELLNAETSMKEAQTNYLKALVQVKLAELDLLKSTGTLSTLTPNPASK